MKTRAALFTAASLSLAALLPPAALASTNWEQDDGKAKTKTIKVVSVTGTGGFLGVGVADVEEDRAKELGLKDDYGVEVNSVVKDSAASKAGIKKGDVVLEYNGTKIESTTQFIRMVRETRPGKQIKMQVFRDGHTISLTGQMEKREPQVYSFKGNNGNGYSVAVPDSDTDVEVNPDNDFDIDIPDMNIHIPDIAIPDTLSWRMPRLGVETEGLGPQLAEFFGVKDGVLVRSVVKDSAAEKAGLKAGDVIVKIAGQEVTRAGDISSVLRSSEAQDVPIVVMRNRKEITVTAKIESRSHGAQTLPKKRSMFYMGPMPSSPEWEENESEDL